MAKNSKINQDTGSAHPDGQREIARIVRLLVSSALLKPDELNRLKQLDKNSLNDAIRKSSSSVSFVNPDARKNLIFTIAKDIGSIEGEPERINIEQRLYTNNPEHDLNTAGLELAPDYLIRHVF
jgi:hypothetical protein